MRIYEEVSDYQELQYCVCFQTVGCRPIASLDHFLPENLGSAALVEEVPMGASKAVKVSPIEARLGVLACCRRVAIPQAYCTEVYPVQIITVEPLNKKVLLVLDVPLHSLAESVF